MTIKELFTDAMSVYNQHRRQSAGIVASASSVQIIENKIPQFLNNILAQYENYQIKGSCGVGRWAEIPWITMMNTNVTSHVSSGYYLTYLLSGDMEHVYLAFMFAVTDNKELENLISEAEDILKQSDVKLNEKINIGRIEYLGEALRAKQYAKAAVAYIHYPKINMPERDEVWVQDLRNMISLYEYYIKKIEGEDSIITSLDHESEQSIKLEIGQLLPHIQTYLKSKGFRYSLENIKNLYLSLRSKPFVIISGISGTGKTKVVELFAEGLGATEENGRFKLIPVRPDWSDGSELLGYVDLKGDFVKGPLTEMVERAHEQPELPHFLLLDEMNLARVEYYFSDVLSVMESRKRDGDVMTSSVLIEDKHLGRALTLPSNLYIIGTVNMDETTHPFSKKVLDRANTLEFNDIDLENFDFLVGHDDVEPIIVSNALLEPSFINIKDIYGQHEQLVKWVSKELATINGHLKHMKAEVGYRVRDEICFYMVWNDNEGECLLERDEAFDFCLMQKVLPRILGSGQHVHDTLTGLFQYLTGETHERGIDVQMMSTKYPKSVKKIADMLEGFYDVGFTSFWSA